MVGKTSTQRVKRSYKITPYWLRPEGQDEAQQTGVFALLGVAAQWQGKCFLKIPQSYLIY